MEISKGIKIVDLALYLKEEATLIFGDLHLGYEEYMHKKGIFVPKTQAKDIFNLIKKQLKLQNQKKL